MFISCHSSQMALLGIFCIYSFSEGQNHYEVNIQAPSRKLLSQN